MGYLAGYDHDLFVSYAHGDKPTPWARALCNELAKCLNDFLELKGSSADVWMDDLLQNNYSLDQLKERIDKSALLLAVISNPYLRSPWCQSEASWFADICKTRAESDGNLFIVKYRQTDESAWPAFLKDSRGNAREGFAFYSRDRNATADPFPFGYPVPDDAEDESRRNFFATLLTLTEQMGNQIKKLAKLPPASPVARPPTDTVPTSGSIRLRTEPAAPSRESGKPTVYLAVATEDVAPEHEALRARLGEAGFSVLPRPEDNQPAAVQRVMSTLPPDCAGAVMVLGALPGRSTPIEDQDLVIWQHDEITRQKLKSVVWQPPPLDLSQIRDAKYRAFVEKIQPNRSSDADKIVAEVKGFVQVAGGTQRVVFLDMLDTPESSGVTRDDPQLDRKLRGILVDLNALVLPANRRRLANEDLSTQLKYRQDLSELKANCDGVVLLAQKDDLRLEYWLLEVARYVVPKASRSQRYAVIDATDNGSLGSIDGIKVFQYASPSLRTELQQWLA